MIIDAEFTMEELLAMVKDKYDSMCTKLEHCQKQLTEFSAQDEIKKANEYAESIREHSLFTMSAKEAEAIKEFKAKHFSCQSDRLSTSYEYVLTGTGIGTAISIRCPVCGEEKNVTDYDMW